MASLVWTDYRLAVLFTVLTPLIIFGWAFFTQSDAINRLMVIYWRVASLLAISVYILIGALPIGFVSGWLARIIIPVGLWYWIDLNEDIRDQPNGPLKTLTTTWRWAVTFYCILSAIVTIPTLLRCGFTDSKQLVGNPTCSIWLQPPWQYREIFHGSTKADFLGILGLIGLVIYGVYLAYFIFFRLSKKKRSALGQ
ncbi:MAG: DUF3177 family protein [Synechococcales bacterium]|nr:DUF3177 family protein [Synechococcales bacterium]